MTTKFINTWTDEWDDLEDDPEHPKADRSKPQPDTIPAHQNYLAFDGRTHEWSLWQRSDDRLFDELVVGWQGEVDEFRTTSYTHWDLDRYVIYYVAPDDASLIVMGARHLDTPGWVKFAARHVARNKLKAVG